VIDQPLETRWPRPLRLRTLTPADAGVFARHAAADVEHLREHLGWAESASDPAGAFAWLKAYAAGDGGRVLVAGAFDGEEIVGGALLMNHDPDAAKVELGCWTSSAVEGHGVARAACAALIGYARRDLHAERVAWRCTTLNFRSRALAERLGFHYEGTLRSAYLLGGRRYDMDVLSLVGAELDAYAGP
jgi:ribosomal-protein-serine acetyltransferase